jgi:hypothetical protein
VGLHFAALKSLFTVRMTLTHEFSFRYFDGAPEATYNEMLEKFDLAVTRYFQGTRDGQIVLVETFWGNAALLFLCWANRGFERRAWRPPQTIPGLQIGSEQPKRSELEFHHSQHCGTN